MKPFITIHGGLHPRRECLPVQEITDCLLQAYDWVARRAYQIFLSRGGRPGGELEDWLNAEQELLGDLPVNVEDGGESLSALASLPDLSGEEIKVGVDSRWLAILGHPHPPGQSTDEARRSMEFDQVAAWISTIHTDDRTLRINCRGGQSSGSLPMPHAAPRLPAQLSAQSHLRFVTTEGGLNPENNSPRSGSAQMNDGASERSASAASTDASRDPGSPDHADMGRRNSRSQLLCVLELPAEIDPPRCTAILANGLLAVRMPKRNNPAN